MSIATSRKGPKFTDIVGELAKRWIEASSVLVVFGSPERGLHEIAREGGINLNDIADFVVNTIPEQGTETVRTEEALLASLAILNVQFGV